MYVALSADGPRLAMGSLGEMWRWLCTLEGTWEPVIVVEQDSHGACHRKWVA